MSSILKSDALISSIKRRAFIPKSQETFKDEDFLEIATEQVNLAILPLIQKMHEEHLVYSIDVPLIQGQLAYAIPSRAHGDKLRDVAYVDGNGSLYEMFRYSLSEVSDFSGSFGKGATRGFYLQNNELVLASSEYTSNAFLRMYFYMRPNKLVKVDRAGTIVGQTIGYEVDQINPLTGTITSISTSSIITCINHGLISGDVVSFSNTDSTPVLISNYTVSVIDSDNFSIQETITVAGTAGSFTKLVQVNLLSINKIPSHFTQSLKYDLVQNVSPNKIIHYDIICNSLNTTTNTISLVSKDVPKLKVGYYLTQAEETIVPNIPTELHPMLAQRVAIYCLEALGHEDKKISAERTLKEMEMNAGSFLDNRTEGALVKIKARHSTLAQSVNGYGRRGRGF